MDIPWSWTTADDLGPEVTENFWTEFAAVGLGPDLEHLQTVAQKLFSHGRPAAAVDVLALYCRKDKPGVPLDFIATVLEGLVAASEAEQRRVSPYELQELLEVLRTNGFDEDRLSSLEWQVLPGLGYGTPAPALERRLARDPEFFVMVLSMCFKRSDGQTDSQPNPAGARNAFHLLHEWEVVPGSTARLGEVDPDALAAWLTRALQLVDEADRAQIGRIYIGHSFAHAREDPDGTWPTRPVRDAVEKLAMDDIDHGFGIQIENNRGVTSRGLTDGGRQESELAEKFERWEGLIRDQWPRTAAVLRSVAGHYRIQARQEDEEVERLIRGVEGRS
jgi:hypothetical protein